ncbi:MAG: phytoene desaturase family protein [Burkholderiales bacterium]
MKKVIIIGAGIAGLTCGIYARLNGFDTEIYESHSIPGGECTGWDRGEYHFDGCVHWLVGTKPGTPLYGMWRDTGALDDSVKIINHDVFTRYEEDGKSVSLYTNADRLEKHLLEIAPEDRKAIKQMCGAIRGFGGLGMPLDKPMDMMTAGDGIKYAAKNFGVLTKVLKYGKMTIGQLAEQFTNPLIKRALLGFLNKDYTSISLLSALGGMNAGDCGFPQGGSRAMARRMEKRYVELGGKVFYKAKADKIIVESGKAAGIRLADGSEVFGDHVVSCADGYATLKVLLDDKYTPPIYDKLFGEPKRYITPTCSIVFLGVGTVLSDTTRGITVRRRQPAALGGVEDENVNILNYSYEKSFAPEGKTVLACFYSSDYDYWNGLYGDKEKYESEKRRLTEDAISAVTVRFPETKGHIEVTDVVTPMTYQKFCNAWRGSWMSWTGVDKDIPQYFPGLLPGLDNFIMAGMWTLPPGGLPGAGAAGRYAAHRLCVQNGIEFKTT